MKKDYFGSKPKTVTCECGYTYIKTSITKGCPNPKCYIAQRQKQRAIDEVLRAREMARRGYPPEGLRGQALKAYRTVYSMRILC